MSNFEKSLARSYLFPRQLDDTKDAAIELLRNSAAAYSDEIIDKCPDTDERQRAHEALRESLMWAIASVSHGS